jgi:hypothetical protein
MGFKFINLIYIAIWFFNIYSYVIAKRIDDLVYDDTQKTAIKRFLYANQNLISILLKLKPLLLIIISIIMSIITISSTLETTRLFISIYFLLTFTDLILNAFILSIYEKKQ